MPVKYLVGKWKKKWVYTSYTFNAVFLCAKDSYALFSVTPKSPNYVRVATHSNPHGVLQKQIWNSSPRTSQVQSNPAPWEAVLLWTMWPERFLSGLPLSQDRGKDTFKYFPREVINEPWTLLWAERDGDERKPRWVRSVVPYHLGASLMGSATAWLPNCF